MKNLVLFIFMFFALAANSQEGLMEIYPLDKGSDAYSVDSSFIMYFVGDNLVPGHPIEIKYCHKENLVNLPNGRKIAGLGHILSDKNEYIGGEMIFKGDTTVIFDMEIKLIDNGALLFVYGNDFSMRFAIDNGIILSDSEDQVVFLTGNEVLWNINKKTSVD